MILLKERGSGPAILCNGEVGSVVGKRPKEEDYRRLEVVSKQIIKVCAASRAREMFAKSSDVV